MEAGNRILAKGVSVSNDMHRTRLNNNDVIIGASGSGKSTGYVIPNIRQNSDSMIIADAKNSLYRNLHRGLEAKRLYSQGVGLCKSSKNPAPTIPLLISEATLRQGNGRSRIL